MELHYVYEGKHETNSIPWSEGDNSVVFVRAIEVFKRVC